MLVRVVLFLAGAGLAAGGGYVSWLYREMASQLFPPAPGLEPWLLVGGLAALTVGLVLVVGAFAFGGARATARAAEAERVREAIRVADAFYADRARGADRDWRSGPLPPEPAVRAPPARTDQDVRFVAPTFPPVPAAEPVASPPPPAPAPPSSSAIRRDDMLSAHLKPFASSANLAVTPGPLDPPSHTAASVAPPAAASEPALVAEPVPSPAAPAVATAAQDVEQPPAFADIRAAIDDLRLEDADRLMAEERARLSLAGESARPALAELTGLAGDHAEAAGRPGNARWLWRLALKRFEDSGAIASPQARALSEKLRLIDS